MNLIRGIAGLLKKKPDEDSKRSFFTEYTGFAVLSRIEKGKRIALFTECKVTFDENDKKPFTYVLHIENEGPHIEEGNEYFFPISKDLQLKCAHYTSEKGKERVYEYLFQLDGLEMALCFIDNEEDALSFREIICKLIWQVENKQWHEEGDAEPDHFCMEIPSKVFQKPKEVAVDEEEKLARELEAMRLSGSSEAKSEIIKGDSSKTKVMSSPSSIAASVTSSVHPDKNTKDTSATLKLSPSVDMQKVMENVRKDKSTLACFFGSFSVSNNDGWTIINEKTAIQVKSSSPFSFKFLILNESGQAIYQKGLNGELNYMIDEKTLRFKWIDTLQDIKLYAMNFYETSATITLKFTLARCIFESNHQESLTEVVKKEETDWANRYFEDNYEEEQPIEDDFEDDDIWFDERHSVFKSQFNDNKVNTGLTQARVLDRTFVTRSDVVSVYKTDDDTGMDLELICNLPPVKSLQGNTLYPKKLMMHEGDAKILLLNEHDDSRAYYMDLETGKVVDEFYVDGANTITEICPTAKHAEFTSNPMFIGINKRNMFLMDPRVNEKEKAVQQKIYAKSPDFSTISVNNEGQLATGSQNGDIRLYKEVGQNAKNLYQGLGDPILSLDCTKDGKWLLATCHKYLILLPTFTTDNKNGFKQPLGKDKPIPIRLFLKPEDLAKYGIKEVAFTPARFDENQDKKEKFIVSGIAEYIVTWSLKNAASGRRMEYDIKRVEDKVVSNEFRYNTDDSLYVALKNSVRLQKTKVIHKSSKGQ